VTPKALIIEDDATLAMVYAEALRSADFDTAVIHTGQAAMDYLAVSSPQIIVLDLHLPDVSGIRIVEQVRSLDHLGETRIIVTSGDPGLADTVREQVDLVLDKPVSTQQLQLLSSRMRPAD
jgi:DNA-binding response OmpR family regulator